MDKEVVWLVLRVEEGEGRGGRALKALKCHFELPFQFAASSLASAPTPRLPACRLFLPVRPSIHPRANPSEEARSQFLCVCKTDDFVA